MRSVDTPRYQRADENRVGYMRKHLDLEKRFDSANIMDFLTNDRFQGWTGYAVYGYIISINLGLIINV